MRGCVLFSLLALLVAVASATHGSITRDLFQEDVKDEPHAEGDNVEEESDADHIERLRNPCYTKKCGRGEMCSLDADLKPHCVCNTDCSYYEQRPSSQVCSNLNRTYVTECNLDKDHCLCQHQEPGCSEPGVGRIYLNYYGACQDQLPCPENSAVQFPLRMRNWLLVVMEDMARRAALGQYEELLAQAAQDAHHAYAVIWKFCDLDQDPQDRQVTKRELQYTIRTLRALEGCIVPFLDNCDVDEDSRISLREWGHCLQLNDNEIVDKCLDIHKHQESRK